MAFEGLRSRWHARQLGSDADLATFRTLHTASLASPALREGLNPESVGRSLKHLRTLLGTAAVAIADTHHLLGYDGLSTHHEDQAHHVAGRAIEAATTVVAGPASLTCETEGCLVRNAIASPLLVEDRVVGALVALTDRSSITSGLAIACRTRHASVSQESSSCPATTVLPSSIARPASRWACSEWWVERPSYPRRWWVSVIATAAVPSRLRRCRRLRSTDSGFSPSRSAGEASDAVCSVRKVARSASLPS